MVKAGCQWRMLPGDFAPWKLIYYYFDTWKKNGIFELIHESLVEKTRLKHGKKEQPTVGIIDAQSVKSTLVSSEDKGFDAGKKIKGIKRHIIVDTLGLVLAIVIQGASVQDRDGAIPVISKLFEGWNQIIKIFATFKVLPKKWIVERTFSWIDTNRRNSKNYERLNNTSVAMVHLSAIRIMLNRF